MSSSALPLPPAAQISDIVNGVNQIYNNSPLPQVEQIVTIATYTYAPPVDSNNNPLAANALLLVSTAFQKTIQIPNDLPVGTYIRINDISGNAGTSMIIIQPLNGLLIDGLNANLYINVNWGSILLIVQAEGVYTVGRYYVQSQYFDSLCLYEQTIDSSVTIPGTNNALSVGPITIEELDPNNQPVNVTVSNGSRWVIV
jgi:hypothetical protein